MDKTRAIEYLNGPVAAAKVCGCSHQAVCKWPQRLPRRIADRVIAGLVREGKNVPKWMLQA